MTTLLFAAGIALAISGLVVFPIATHSMLEAHSPRSWKRLPLALLAVLVNFTATALGGVFIWLACTR